MAIWSRNKIWGASTFNTDVDVADNTNNASQVPATSFLGLKISSSVDAESRNRSKWFTSIIGQLLRAVLHKEEDRATGANIGVSGTGIESTEVIYVTPSQLPEVDKTTNDFSTPAKSDSNGALTTTNDLFNVSTVTTDRKNKKFVIKLSDTGVLFFKARTWLQSELQTLITDTATPLIDDAIADIPAPATYTGSELTPFVINSLTYVNVPNVLFTNSANTAKYLVSFTYTVFIATNDVGGETNGVVVKVFNEDTAGIYDESEFQLGAVTTAANTKTQGSFQSILTLSPTHRIRLAAKCTGSLEAGGAAQTISNVRFSILEIK